MFVGPVGSSNPTDLLTIGQNMHGYITELSIINSGSNVLYIDGTNPIADATFNNPVGLITTDIEWSEKYPNRLHGSVKFDGTSSIQINPAFSKDPTIFYLLDNNNGSASFTAGTNLQIMPNLNPAAFQLYSDQEGSTAFNGGNVTVIPSDPAIFNLSSMANGSAAFMSDSYITATPRTPCFQLYDTIHGSIRFDPALESNISITPVQQNTYAFTGPFTIQWFQNITSAATTLSRIHLQYLI
jgi:hypothetical protein